MVKRLIPESLYEALWRASRTALAIKYSLKPIQKNKIFVTSYYGADYGDNGKYIVEELLRRNADLDIVWQIKDHLVDDNHLPKGVRAVKYYSNEAIFEAQTAAIWIDNSRKYFGIKRKGQLYIQTWHGGPGIKRCEKDVEDELEKRYLKNAKRDSRMCDLIISNSTFMTNLFRSSFWYDGPILECGTPRNDVICASDPAVREKVCRFFSLSDDVKLLLYAPTFRKDRSLDAYDIDFKACLDALRERFGGEWKVLLRLHPNISHKASLMGNHEDVIAASAYSDMQELLAAADCLITDYSSSNVDFMISKKPCFLYASDLEEYKKDRGFYFAFEDFPFPLSTDMDRLLTAIREFDEPSYLKRLEDFSRMTGHCEAGTASKTVADIIQEHISNI